MTSQDFASEFRAALRHCGPFIASVIPTGMIFGALAVAAGLSAVEAIAMSGLVYSGAAQFTGLQLAAPAIIAALLAMGLIFDKETGALDLSLGNDYLVGGLLAVLIAVWVRNFSAATALGFVAFLAIRALH